MQYILKKIKISQETVISCNCFHYKQSGQSFSSSTEQFFEYSINIETDLCFQTFVSWSDTTYHNIFYFIFAYSAYLIFKYDTNI